MVDSRVAHGGRQATVAAGGQLRRRKQGQIMVLMCVGLIWVIEVLGVSIVPTVRLLWIDPCLPCGQDKHMFPMESEDHR